MSSLPADQLKLLPRGGAVLAATFIIAALWPTLAAAQGSCTVNRVTFSAGIDCVSTDSATFIDIPQAALDVTVGGAAPTCVIVAFSAQTKTTSKENMDVRARIADVGIGEPEDVTFGAGTRTLEARATQFVFANVPPGNHALRMQFRSVEAGTTVKMCEPTLVVYHK